MKKKRWLLICTILCRTCPSRQPNVRLKNTGKRASGITSGQWVERWWTDQQYGLSADWVPMSTTPANVTSMSPWSTNFDTWIELYYYLIVIRNRIVTMTISMITHSQHEYSPWCGQLGGDSGGRPSLRSPGDQLCQLWQQDQHHLFTSTLSPTLLQS